MQCCTHPNTIFTHAIYNIQLSYVKKSLFLLGRYLIEMFWEHSFGEVESREKTKGGPWFKSSSSLSMARSCPILKEDKNL